MKRAPERLWVSIVVLWSALGVGTSGCVTETQTVGGGVGRREVRVSTPGDAGDAERQFEAETGDDVPADATDDDGAVAADDDNDDDDDEQAVEDSAAQGDEPDKGDDTGDDSDEDVTLDAACAERMGDIAAAMLHYHAANGRLPEELEDLRPTVARFGGRWRAGCPLTGEPYAYNPAGLTYPGSDPRLVLYDPSPAHDGSRWGVVISEPGGGRPASVYVVRLAEEVFRGYQAP